MEDGEEVLSLYVPAQQKVLTVKYQISHSGSMMRKGGCLYKVQKAIFPFTIYR